jgi:hypothetical protein
LKTRMLKPLHTFIFQLFYHTFFFHIPPSLLMRIHNLSFLFLFFTILFIFSFFFTILSSRKILIADKDSCPTELELKCEEKNCLLLHIIWCCWDCFKMCWRFFLHFNWVKKFYAWTQFSITFLFNKLLGSYRVY